MEPNKPQVGQSRPLDLLGKRALIAEQQKLASEISRLKLVLQAHAHDPLRDYILTELCVLEEELVQIEYALQQGDPS
ncbi:hypothetical protein [Thermoflavifilum thermophilum]|uniref:Histidine kinase n=1 Tax=Thermoflavifilum thermophilum TaxID=1393122 RepID=A0A1I7N3Q9_9BACT|nr:hypothetical protein [Thermoflavifilum thermophilum]SFV29226.1 hypothetical protein SAMN05660895_0506 [Thermoflavifilum thermophilum]